MSKYLKSFLNIVALIVTSGLLLCSCNHTQNAGDESSNDTEKSPGNAEYVYGFLPSEASNPKLNDSFVQAAELGLYTNSYEINIKDVKSKVKSCFTSEDAAYKYSNCSELKSGTGEYGSFGDFYSIYDTYGSEHETLSFLHGTDMLCRYVFFEEGLYEAINLTVEEAINVSNEFLHSFLSDEQLAKFEAPVVEGGIDGIYKYRIRYVRKIAGFETDETITVFISLSGKAYIYNGMNMDKYDEYIDVIKEDNVKASKKLLEDQIHSLGLLNYSMSDPLIVTNTSGELFLQIDVTYDDIPEDGVTMKMVDSYFVNILDQAS